MIFAHDMAYDTKFRSFCHFREAGEKDLVGHSVAVALSFGRKIRDLQSLVD
jgi:hypothetical protein